MVNEVLSDAAVLKRQAHEIEELRKMLTGSGYVHDCLLAVLLLVVFTCHWMLMLVDMLINSSSVALIANKLQLLVQLTASLA